MWERIAYSGKGSGMSLASTSWYWSVFKSRMLLLELGLPAIMLSADNRGLGPGSRFGEGGQEGTCKKIIGKKTG